MPRLCLSLLFLMAVLTGSAQRSRSAEPALRLDGPPFVSARAWAIVDGKSGEFLWGENEDLPSKAASTTKMMCLYVVLQLADQDPGVLDETITFSELADKTVGSTSAIEAGESLPVRECLYGLMLPSGNDAGNALAEHFNDRCAPPEDGSEPDPAFATRARFIAEMNRQAQKLGMKDTVYRLPYGDGGTDEDRTTTCRDLLRLAWAGMQDPRFRGYVGTKEHSTEVKRPDGSTRRASWTNTNQLLPIEGFDGVKTGTNDGAGACLVSSGHRGDDHLMMAVLGATSAEGRYVDSKNLYRWAWLERGHTAD